MPLKCVSKKEKKESFWPVGKMSQKDDVISGVWGFGGATGYSCNGSVVGLTV